MLVLYNKAHERLATLAGVADMHLQRVLDGGDEQLTFTYPRSGQWAAELQAEAYVRTDRQEYVIKSTDKKTSAQRVTVAAALNIEGLEGVPIEGGFETVEKTIAECMAVALEGSGWAAVVHGGITKRRTVRIEEDTTAWAVAKSAITTYRVEVEIKALDKTLHFYAQRGQDRGVYFFERLNLRALGVKSSSYGFFTRLKPIGKDGLHLWIDEKDTLENHQYSQKDITAIWRDERYTNTTSLLEDAQAKLEEASKPILAYTGDIVDLAAQSDCYSLLDYDLGDVVILASESTGERTRQRIVKLDEYPLDHTKDKAEFSNASKTFAQLQKSADEAAKQEAIEVAGRKFTQTLKDGYYTKEETTTAIRALDDEIQLEVSKTFMTKGEGEENAKKAQAAAEDAGTNAQAAAKEYTDGQLVNYSTTSQMQSAITQAADGIKLEVSKTYATVAAAKEYTDGQLVNYSTTSQMQSAITQAADGIKLEVSKTYATSSELGDYTKNDEVRSKFAMDAESVTVETGKITFKSNTIVIDSTNFKLDANGNVSAKGTFKTISTETGWQASMDNGGVTLSNNGEVKAYLFQAGNYDAAYLRLVGTYGGYNAGAWYAPDGMSINRDGVCVFNVGATGTVTAAGTVKVDGGISANGKIETGGDLSVAGNISMPSSYEGTLYMHKSKFCPCDGQNSLYTNWVSVKGADGNNYWALCGFSYYPGT